MRNFGVLNVLVASSLAFAFAQRASAAAGDKIVQAQLFADVSAIKPGESFNLGIQLKIMSDWHIYWKNPGDAGLATKVKLDLPPGFTSEALQYPVPARIDLPGDIINYVYQDEVMLLVRVTAPKDLSTASPVVIPGKVSWLVCKEVCLPGSALLQLELPVSADVSPANAEMFHQWTDRLPLDRDPAHVADVSASHDAAQGKIIVHWRSVPSDIQWFPASSGMSPTDVKISTRDDTTEISYHLQADAGKASNIESVLAYTAEGKRIGLTLADHAN
jgi:DsbC/DsbD-like thiol-disulfide interchange protein